jgi:hypothetical protein
MLGDGSRLTLIGNVGSEPATGFALPAGEPIFESQPGLIAEVEKGQLPGWSLIWFLALQT